MTRKIYNRHKECKDDHNARYMPTPEQIAEATAAIRAARDGHGETIRQKTKVARDADPAIKVCSTELFPYMPMGVRETMRTLITLAILTIATTANATGVLWIDENWNDHDGIEWVIGDNLGSGWELELNYPINYGGESITTLTTTAADQDDTVGVLYHEWEDHPEFLSFEAVFADVGSSVFAVGRNGPLESPPFGPYGIATRRGQIVCIPEPSSFATLLLSCLYGYGRRTRRMGA